MCNRMMLGWLHHRRGLPLEAVCLQAMVPSKERDGADVAYAFMEFIANDRRVGARGQVQPAIHGSTLPKPHVQSTITTSVVAFW